MLTRRGDTLCDWLGEHIGLFPVRPTWDVGDEIREAVSWGSSLGCVGRSATGVAAWLPREGFVSLAALQGAGQTSIFIDNAAIVCGYIGSLRLLARVLEEGPSWRGPGPRLPISCSPLCFSLLPFPEPLVPGRLVAI